MKKRVGFIAVFSLVILLFFGAVFTKSTFAISKPAETEKQAYTAIYNALKERQGIVYVKPGTEAYRKVWIIFNKVLDDHPGIFYVDTKNLGIWTSGKLEIKYQQNAANMANDLNKKTSAIISSTIKPRMTQLEKVMAIHDYVVLNTSYDYDNYRQNRVPPESNTAFGVLIKGKGVCSGYAKSMMLLLNKAGIETKYITGTAGGEGHAWNLVKIDNRYYYLDATWDDPVPDQKGKVRYAYFLVDANTLAKDHRWNKTGLPVANNTNYNYFQSMDKKVRIQNTLYYTNAKDHNRLYRINLDGNRNQIISDQRAPHFVINKGWIYFSNYSNGGYLYKMKLNGSMLQQLNTTHSVDLEIKQNWLYYRVNETNQYGKINL